MAPVSLTVGGRIRTIQILTTSSSGSFRGSFATKASASSMYSLTGAAFLKTSPKVGELPI